MLQGLRLSLRALKANPGFVVVATATLAVGIGANTAVFSVFDAVLLRSLPVDRPRELVVLGPGAVGTLGRSDMPQTDSFSYPQYEALRDDHPAVLAGVAATPTFGTNVYWGDSGGPGAELQQASCHLVSGSYFGLLGVRAYRGRLLGPADDGAPGSSPVVVLGHSFWRNRLGGDPAALNATIRLNGEPYTVVGVADPNFRGHVLEHRPDIWAPMSMQPNLTRSPSRLQPSRPYETYWLNIVARLAPGATLQRAEAAVQVRMQQIFREQVGEDASGDRLRDIADIRISLTPVARGLSRLRGSLQTPLAALWAATSLVLLIACANLGNLLLVRAADRRHEIGIQQALGATRWRLARKLLLECTILASAGTVLGCWLAHWLVAGARTWLGGADIFGAIDARLDLSTLAFAAAVGVASVLLFGLLPALWAARDSVAQALRAGGPTASAPRGETRVKGLLVATQCAFSLTLLTAAGLFLRTLNELRAVDLGLDAEQVVGLRLDPRGGGFPQEGQPAMRRRILDRVEAIPGIKSAAFTGSLPLQGNHGRRTLSVSGYDPAEDEDMSVIHVWASPRYFETLGIRVLQGRPAGFGAPDAVTVNQAFAKRYFPDGAALGGMLNGKSRIVGIVADVRHLNVRDDPPPIVYPASSRYEGFLGALAVRSALPRANSFQVVRQAVLDTVPGMPISPQPRSVEGYLDRAVALETLLARLVGAFGAIAALLTALGLYGVTSQAVRTRRGEIGIRMAVGATCGSIRGLVLRRSASLIAAGAAAGVLGAYAAGGAASRLLYGVQPFEWGVIGWALLLLAAVGAPAALVPALRAGRVSPASALRQE